MKLALPGIRLSTRLVLGLGVCLFAADATIAAAEMPEPDSAATVSASNGAKPTVDEARKFIADAESRLLQLTVDAQRADWVQVTFITYDTEILAAQANEKLLIAGLDLAKGATRFEGVELPPDLRRRMELLRTSLILPSPNDPKKTAELTRLQTKLEGAFGAGKYCPPGGGACRDLQQLSDVMDKSRDPKELLEAWTEWHSVARPMRQDYASLAAVLNDGARDLGFKDAGALWRAKYDMTPDAFAAEVDRLWNQVKPFYDALHCHVRAKLNEKYGDAVVPLDKPIPAHLLGNMWAQTWDNVYDLVAPPNADPGYDLTERLQAKKVTPIEMVKDGERFFTSLGFAPLPPTFWERSLFTQPRDRDVVCHASAWDVDSKDDLRIKLCIKVNNEDFKTVHHELGHNFYQRAYNTQPFLFQESAIDGFHEAVGDTIALSITPGYLKQIGLIDQIPDPSKDLGILMKLALEKMAFMPFGLLVDQWRWKVFSGEIQPADYNKAWWQLREKYQGVRAPVARTEDDFDPGAKYHVAASVPYTRYFLAHILQFQFHRGLCEAAGYKGGPLNRCSIYGSKAAGERLNKMLSMGLSQPWPEALKVATGTEQMDATAILDYFAPLKTWLDQQNQGRKCGW